ncbi:DUF6064 family protein [Hoeflea sp.]|uniref:DUF6064 family protein n=1 Tax=Hoeflea sp. TaxID=1940281 RepID=UPI0019B4BF73|nr:DUF6064 family protein [Hoeflea sp.]MBC7282978.1 hypothetical protein [Hoeflea sp.]
MLFTQDEFFNVFAAYNAAIWPLPLFTYLLGVMAVGFSFWQSRVATVLISAVLTLMWFVNGVAYHWSFFSEINPLARGFGILFVVQGLLLICAPLFWKFYRIQARRDARTLFGIGLAAFAAFVYPALGWLIGHAYPAVPVFGVAPCPTTIFTIGILLLGTWKVVRWLLVIPALWALIGGSAAVLLNVPQDFGLIAAVLVALGFAVADARGVQIAHHETS